MIFEKQLIYYPAKALDVTPKALGLAAEGGVARSKRG
jgi:hypothetical protein